MLFLAWPDRDLEEATTFGPSGSWDMAAGDRAVETLARRGDGDRAAAYAPDGLVTATAEPGTTIAIRNTDSGQELFSLEGHAAEVWALAFSPDGSILASGSFDTTIRLWDVATRQVRAGILERALPAGCRLSVPAFSPDGQTAGLGRARTEAVRIWEKRSRPGTSGPPSAPHTDAIHCLAFAPDSRTLASAGKDGVVRLWDLKRAEPTASPVPTAPA